MKNLITRELLLEAEKEFVEKSSSTALGNAYEAHASRSAKTTEITVFLSHKHSDKILVKGAVALFASLGVETYVDWLDSSMPPVTNTTTANKLKQKIRSCNKFVLLASNEAIDSKWCNWELGLGDAAKYFKNIAILPAAGRGREWKGNEYLGIYSVITSEYEYLPGSYFVEFGSQRQPLKSWLKS